MSFPGEVAAAVQRVHPIESDALAQAVAIEVANREVEGAKIVGYPDSPEKAGPGESDEKCARRDE